MVRQEAIDKELGTMTRIALAAVLAAAAFMSSPHIALAAKGGFKGGFKPVPFRANGLLGPVTPRTLSHSGLPAKFHGHHKKHIVEPIIVGLTGGGLALLNPAPFPDSPDEIVRPVLVPVGGMVGCVTEDVGVTGGTVSIIRC
jgi:hypothetical protein